MASIVWRWNHPNNSRNQQSTRGYPNEKLMNDIALFDAFIDTHLATVAEEDITIGNRMAYLRTLSLIHKDRLRKLANDDREEARFIRRCDYTGWPYFTSDDGANPWERSFLIDMRRNFLNGYDLSDKQAETLNNILRRPSKEATTRQKSYLLRNGYDGDVETLTLEEASMIITVIDKSKEE